MCCLAWPRLARVGLLLIGVACILFWLLPRDAPEIERASHDNRSGPGPEPNIVSAVARIDSATAPIPTWMYHGDDTDPDALDQLLHREWLRPVLSLPPLDLALGSYPYY